MDLTARNASLQDIAALLTEQRGRALDIVAPATALRSVGGNLVVTGSEPILSDEGVTSSDGTYVPTVVAEEGLAAKLQIPLAYVRRMRAERPDLFDANVNGWLGGGHLPSGVGPADLPNRVEGGDYHWPADPRSFMVRTFRGDDGGPGVLRAFLSQSYKVIDNLDVLTAALDGVRQAGVEVDITGADLTERRMYVRIAAPAIQALAPTLLGNYRSPFTGNTGADNPTVFAGFVLSNSETGCGAFTITPRLTVQVCNNGMTMTKDALRSIHIGGKMDEGVIRWTDDTQEKNLALVAAKTRDAVATFLDTAYVEKALAAIEEQATHKLAKPAEAIQIVSTRLRYTEAQTAGILDHFIRGGDTTAGGVLHAVTSYAQVIPDADEAAEFEESGLRALEVAASL